MDPAISSKAVESLAEIFTARTISEKAALELVSQKIAEPHFQAVPAATFLRIRRGEEALRDSVALCERIAMDLNKYASNQRDILDFAAEFFDLSNEIRKAFQ